VTLDGNLIDTSGTMSGGGNIAQKGSMRLRTNSTKLFSKCKEGDEAVITKDFILQQEELIKNLQENLSECRELRAESEKKLNENKNNIKEVELEISKIKITLGGFEDQLGEFFKRSKDLEHSIVLSNDEENDIKRHEQQIETIERDITKISPDLKKLSCEVSSIQREILGVGGPKLLDAKNKVESMTKKIEMFSSILSGKEIDLLAQEKLLNTAKSNKNKYLAELKKKNLKLENFLSERKKMEKDVKIITAALESAKQSIGLLNTTLQSKTVELNELNKKVIKFRNEQNEILLLIENANSVLKEENSNAQKLKYSSEKIRSSHNLEQTEFVEEILIIAQKLCNETETKIESNNDDSITEFVKEITKFEKLEVVSDADLLKVNKINITSKISMLEDKWWDNS
jgi:structural maintenance of chromosome 4